MDFLNSRWLAVAGVAAAEADEEAEVGAVVWAAEVVARDRAEEVALVEAELAPAVAESALAERAPEVEEVCRAPEEPEAALRDRVAPGQGLAVEDQRLEALHRLDDRAGQAALEAAAGLRIGTVAETSAWVLDHKFSQAIAQISVMAGQQLAIVLRPCRAIDRDRALVPDKASAKVVELARAAVSAIDLASAPGLGIDREQVKESQIVPVSHNCQDSANQALVPNCQVKAPVYRIAWRMDLSRWKIAGRT